MSFTSYFSINLLIGPQSVNNLSTTLKGGGTQFRQLNFYTLEEKIEITIM